jgi:hypothetical protein
MKNIPGEMRHYYPETEMSMKWTEIGSDLFPTTDLFATLRFWAVLELG